MQRPCRGRMIMINQDIAKLFEHTADVLAVQGANSFRVLAYRKVARVLDDMPESVETLAKTDALEQVPGIGESSAEKIREYIRTGKVSEFEEIWSEVPQGVLAIMRIPTVGPKTAALLWQEGGITSVEQLKEKLEKGTIKELPGLGEKKLAKIKQNLEHLEQNTGRVRLGQAYRIAVELVAYIKTIDGVIEAEYCGSLRRARETIGDIDIAVSAKDGAGEKISTAITAHPMTAEVIGSGPTKTSIRTADGTQVDVRIVPPESFGAAVQYFTGSKEHNVRLREIAIKQGYKLNEWGLFKGEKSVAGKTEAEIYHALGMACVPPEMRENRGEIELAQEMGAPKKSAKKPAKYDYELIEIGDIRGDLHMHTVASDGHKTIEEMVAECKRRGYAYCAITDHSKSQFQANGLDAKRLVEHAKAIKAVAKQVKGIVVLAGSEVDILADGSLDYEDDVLEHLDWVVASPHAALTQDSEAATKRLIRAIGNPHVCVIGHPTGRLVPTRRGLEPDMQKVIFAASREGVAMELNANDHRLDLRDVHLKMARDAGVPICIDTDAHAFEDMDQMLYGILTARRGWLRASDVLNTRTADALMKWLKERKNW